MTPADLLRAARDLESQGHFAEADRLRWLAASRAVTGSISPCEPALSDEEQLESAPSCRLSAALRDAEAVGDIATVARLLGVLAGLRPSARRAA